MSEGIKKAYQSRQPPGLAGRLFLLKQIDQIHRGVKAHPLTMSRNPGHAQCRRQMGLAGASTADKDHVVCVFGKRQVRQFRDQAVINLGLGEVEAGQIAMYRELGRVHLIADGAHGPIRTFGRQ